MLMILIASGTQYFFRFNGAITMLGFLIFSIFYYFSNKGKVDTQSKWFSIIYVSYILVNWFIINTNHIESINRMLPYIIFAIGGCLILSRMEKKVMIDSLYSIMKYLALISIVVFALNEFNIVTPYHVYYNKSDHLMSYIHTIGWGVPFHRLAGLWWEPGAYQIVLNMAIFFKLTTYDSMYEIWEKKNRWGFFILLAASILTMSTTGYITLGVLSIYL